MKKITVFFLFFAIFCMFFKMFADDDEDKLKLAVMEFEDLSGKLSKKMLSAATEQIRSKFVSSNKFIVIAKERQENAMIKQMKKESYKLCNDKKCQIPLGQALSADTILRTTINFFGGIYTITSELIDLEKEATIKGASANFDGGEKSLRIAIDNIVMQITGKQPLNLEAETSNRKVTKSSNLVFNGLQWSKKSSKRLDWREAVNYCNNLNEDGFEDWRLPNIDELRTLIINHPGTMTGGSCQISEKAKQLESKYKTKDCDGVGGSNFSKLGDTDSFWSSSVRPEHSHNSWSVDFIYGKVYDVFPVNWLYTRCVRNIA